MNKPCPVVVLIGGNGSNLQALIDAPSTHYEIVGVVSHRPQAYGLERAANHGIPTAVVDHQAYENKSAFEQALILAIEAFSPALVVMAGFMRILSSDFIHHYRGRLLNVHPSLLPKYKGLNTHARVLADNEKQHGVSIHFVTEELDGGPIIAQVTIPVLANDTAESLQQRVHVAEHWLYPQVVDWFAQNRLKCHSNIATLDGVPLSPQGQQLSLPPVQGIVS